VSAPDDDLRRGTPFFRRLTPEDLVHTEKDGFIISDRDALEAASGG
jgi:hypothetical protein